MITIFTPTYNRAYILGALYESLKSQTQKDFEWIIIDDGSTDNTAELVKTFQEEGILSIYYLKQENGGKHRAINIGVRLAHGEWFFIVDSDDRLPNDSIEIISKYIIDIEDSHDFAGVAGNKCYPNGKVVGGNVDYDTLDTDAVSIREHYHVKGDMAEVWRTAVLRQYPFPEFPGEKFMSEGYIWAQISYHYKLRYFNRNIYICDYLNDGLTKNIRSHFRKSPRGTMLCMASRINDSRYSYIHRVRFAINYWRYTIQYSGKRDKKFAPPLWAFLCYPIGLMFYIKDMLR